jgi:geranylgeranyl diphosphate synthase type II
VSGVIESLDQWLAMRRQAVDAALQRFLPPEFQAPSIVVDAMRYSLFAGGKRLRPMLVIASAEAVAERLDGSVAEARLVALPAACAVELIHTYSLIHDDLPAMDDDVLRRGRPTAHVIFGEGLAILSGDALLTEAFALLAREPDSTAASAPTDMAARKLRAIEVLAAAAGAAGMVGGQALDLQAAVPGAPPVDAEGLRGIHVRKTAALIRGSAVSGAIMAGASGSVIDAIGAFAERVGLAFQIVDDILDVEGASADLGKTPGKDSAAGKPTYPVLYGVEESRRLASEHTDRALTAIERAGVSGQLPAIARWVISRTH